MYILVTGSSGLIGAALMRELRRLQVEAVGVDERPAAETDIVHRMEPGDDRLTALVANALGIVHLAGVSRVVWGEADPGKCWRDNVQLTEALIETALAASARPWFVYASSREVYGQADQLPLRDDAQIRPLNIYGCSKAASEALLAQAMHRCGLRGGIIRFSTVYGGIEDHTDRVIPAFVLGAMREQPIRICGSRVALDPTWIGDAVDGVLRLIEALDSGRIPQRAILLSGGTPVLLTEVAELACALTGSRSTVEMRSPRNFDVERFAGLPLYAREFLGWEPRTTLAQGLPRYMELMRVPADT